MFNKIKMIMEDTVKWMKKVYLTIASIVITIVAVIGLVFGKVVEGTLIAEIGKWALMAVVVAAIVCGLAYVPICLLGHKRKELYPKYGKKWFKEALKWMR